MPMVSISFVEGVNVYALFPSNIATETEDWHQEKHEVRHCIGPQPRHYVEVLQRKPDSGGNDGIQWQEEHGKHEGSRDS